MPSHARALLLSHRLLRRSGLQRSLEGAKAAFDSRLERGDGARQVGPPTRPPVARLAPKKRASPARPHRTRRRASTTCTRTSRASCGSFPSCAPKFPACSRATALARPLQRRGPATPRPIGPRTPPPPGAHECTAAYVLCRDVNLLVANRGIPARAAAAYSRTFRPAFRSRSLGASGFRGCRGDFKAI